MATQKPARNHKKIKKDNLEMITVINFKTYKTGKDALKLAKTIEKFNKNIIIGVQPSHLNEIATKTKLKVYSQHVDQFKPERHTGYIIPETIKKDGAKGTFLNHSEHKIPFRILKKTIKVCKETKLKTIVFASNLKEAKRIQKLKPDLLIIEPPELVATKTSVSKEKPELKKHFKEIKNKILSWGRNSYKRRCQDSIKTWGFWSSIIFCNYKIQKPKKSFKRLILTYNVQLSA